MTTLTATELEELASKAFGPNWQSALARDRGVAVRTVQRWAKDGIAKPETAEAIHAYLTTRTVVSLPLKPDRGRTYPFLATAMDELVEDISQAGVLGGWTEDETQRALLHALMAKRTIRTRPVHARRKTRLEYDPSVDPFSIKGKNWQVGADFSMIALRLHDQTVRNMPVQGERRSRVMGQIRERADEISSHSSRSAAYVLGLLMTDQSADPVEMMHRVSSLMEQAQSDEERASLERIIKGNATQADREAAMKSAGQEG